MTDQDKGSDKAQASGLNDAPKKNRFYALRSRGGQETSPNIVTSMLKVLYIGVYALLDTSDTLSFVTPLVAKKFDIFPYVLHEPFIVSTLVYELIVANRVFRNCPIMLPSIFTSVKFVEHDILDFNVILGMN